MAKGTLASFGTTRKTSSTASSGKAKAAITKPAPSITSSNSNKKAKREVEAVSTVLPSSEGDEVVQVNKDGSERRRLKVNDKKYNKLYGELMDENLGEHGLFHMDGHSKVDFILKQFDLAPEFGPAAGMTRLQRWERASKWGLDPPEEVHEILLTIEGREKPEYRESLYDGRF